MITQSEVKKLLNYNKDNGTFVWNENRSSKIKAGDIAGSIQKTGYIHLKINYVAHLAHRIAWLYHYGYMPKFIDHINRDRTDNRIENLRECSLSQNQFNRGIQKNNTSGVKGVSWNKSSNKWLVQFRIYNDNKYIGYFEDLELAKLVASEAYDKYHKEFKDNYAKHG